ncbi:hypothetical protein ACQ3I4_12215 [Zafaria sp. Z1313]|uniref:hypothetical protein n=1 Tax=unclassified Zafaria TaxID=2828765 RepID=UPI002E7912C1|nr:hypothetical protein [Zafaria sp. J156]MEE1621960.1 hypothetical protein [Zafaria sp. J156]
MRVRLWVAAILALFVLYLVASFTSAVRFLQAEEPVAKAIGAGALVLPVIGVWILIREVLFGARTQRMARILEAEGLLPVDDLPRRPSGRIVQEAADADFVQYRQEAEANPTSWRSLHRLALAYDAAGDRGRARQTMKGAVGRFLASPDAARK